MPKVSVITIARNKKEAIPLKMELSKQSFKNFEFIVSSKSNIPESWNDAISKAKGEIIIFTETDARPLTKDWIKEMVYFLEKYNRGDPNKKIIIKGLETYPQVADLSTLGIYKKVFDKNKFNEYFDRCEDAELFSRLRNKGYKFKPVPGAGVLHVRTARFWRDIKNRYSEGYYNAKINLKYRHTGFTSSEKGGSSVLKREIRILLGRLSFLLGIFIGVVTYFFSNPFNGDKK